MEQTVQHRTMKKIGCDGIKLNSYACRGVRCFFCLTVFDMLYLLFCIFHDTIPHRFRLFGFRKAAGKRTAHSGEHELMKACLVITFDVTMSGSHYCCQCGNSK